MTTVAFTIVLLVRDDHISYAVVVFTASEWSLLGGEPRGVVKKAQVIISIKSSGKTRGIQEDLVVNH
jgi:hypothetical protein